MVPPLSWPEPLALSVKWFQANVSWTQMGSQAQRFESGLQSADSWTVLKGPAVGTRLSPGGQKECPGRLTSWARRDG